MVIIKSGKAGTSRATSNRQSTITISQLLTLSHRHQRCHQLDAIPKILQPNILIFRMLIVVVVRDWNSDSDRAEMCSDD
jgi:hypothetical protein